MRRTRPARTIAIPRRGDNVQPTAVLGTLGIIAALLAAWTSLAL